MLDNRSIFYPSSSEQYAFEVLSQPHYLQHIYSYLSARDQKVMFSVCSTFEMLLKPEEERCEYDIVSKLIEYFVPQRFQDTGLETEQTIEPSSFIIKFNKPYSLVDFKNNLINQQNQIKIGNGKLLKNKLFLISHSLMLDYYVKIKTKIFPSKNDLPKKREHDFNNYAKQIKTLIKNQNQSPLIELTVELIKNSLPSEKFKLIDTKEVEKQLELITREEVEKAFITIGLNNTDQNLSSLPDEELKNKLNQLYLLNFEFSTLKQFIGWACDCGLTPSKIAYILELKKAGLQATDSLVSWLAKMDLTENDFILFIYLKFYFSRFSKFTEEQVVGVLPKLITKIIQTNEKGNSPYIVNQLWHEFWLQNINRVFIKSEYSKENPEELKKELNAFYTKLIAQTNIFQSHRGLSNLIHVTQKNAINDILKYWSETTFFAHKPYKISIYDNRLKVHVDRQNTLLSSLNPTKDDKFKGIFVIHEKLDIQDRINAGKHIKIFSLMAAHIDNNKTQIAQASPQIQSERISTLTSPKSSVQQIDPNSRTAYYTKMTETVQKALEIANAKLMKEELKRSNKLEKNSQGKHTVFEQIFWMFFPPFLRPHP